MSEKPTYEALEKRVKELEQAEIEHKRAEDSLLESKDLFRTLSDLAPSGIYLCDVKGNCQYANPRWCEMAGLGMEDALGDGWAKGLHPEDRDYVLSNWQQMVESEGKWGLEYRFQTPAGKVTWVYGLATPQCDALGNIVAYVGINSDITERKESEDALLQMTQRLHMALQVAKAGTWDWDVVTGHIEWSTQLFDLFGLDPSRKTASFELWKSILYPQDVEIAGARIDQALKRQTTLHSDYRIVLPDGQIRWINAVGKGQYDEQGHPIRMIGICMEITERKQAEESLRKAEQQLKLIFDTVPALIWQKDREGRYLQVNKAYCRTVGLSEKDILGKTDYDIFPKEVADQYVTDDIKIQNSGIPKFGIEEQHQKSSGERGWSYTNKMAYCDDDGHPTGTIGFAMDVTERKRAEAALTESEKYYRLLFRNLNAGFALHEIMLNTHGNPCDYRFLEVNPAFEKLTGLTSEEITGKTVLQVMPDTEPYWIETYGKVAKTGEPIYFENYSKELNKHYVVTAYAPETGKFATIFLDITDRKKAEEALQESEEKFRTFSDQSLVGIYLIQDGVFKYVNPKFSEIFGYPVDQCMGLSFDELVYPEDLNTVKENVRKRISGEVKTVHYEFRGIRKNSEIVHLEIFGSSTLFNGKPAAMGTLLDITARKLAEETLRESEEKFSKAFEKTPLLMTISSIEDGTYLDINEEFTKVSGFAREEAIGKSSVELGWLKPKDRELLIHDLKMKGFVEEQELELETKDQRRIICLYHGEVINIGGQQRLLSIAQDITERKRAEDEKVRLEARLQQAQKMESIGSLAGGIAHDLNNILFPISGLSEMLLDEIQPDNHSYESLDQIHKSAQRGSELVKQILAFSRQSNPQKLPIRIQPILKEVVKLSRATIPMNIEITSLINNDCSMVSADPTQVHQIVMNLITNAYHAVEQTGGTINIELKEAEFEKDDTLKPGKYAHITVSDTGIGIDQSVIDKIFDPYFTTKDPGKGTGLGLSVVDGIVKEHGGDIRVYSEVGKGTTFNVYLPLLEDNGDSKTVAVTRKYPTGCERILLVDDEEPILRMEQMMLERLGYQVTTRMSSPDALEAFSSDPSKFDLVISDRGMPNMTGERLARELISIKPEIPIILCTGFADEIDELRAKSMGIKGFLKKPVATGDFAEIVRKVLDEVATEYWCMSSGKRMPLHQQRNDYWVKTLTENQSANEANINKMYRAKSACLIHVPIRR